MTPAGFQAWAHAAAVGVLWLLVAVLALCAIESLVRATITAFLSWRAGIRYRRALADASANLNRAADAFDRDVRAGVPIIPPDGGPLVVPDFPRPMGATCDRAPAGWYCPLHRGHSGQCPAYPITSAHS